ncbi:TPA: tyrosine-type recombinase/integrase [Raoultella ornithinolytica]|uniref:Tyrosine-type recombinase/integrase n=2 Tax=Raoultella TaxID=160674 RepID=A0ABZ2E0F5_RAOOR|nr:tyrosine-type recombinase/integrase [Raoultella ornithinolytica]VDR24795.1 Putative prophage CPS-53 integrase [Raoultella terrigena]EKU2863006.1 tyrosine-type recombinase/integrase [Raoultella ornithinolytica]ELS0898322.1 tyrosine-type recombinase/integrase [Raoultella ornithinolytica]MDI0345702.1 tyrosine-type recombinase/integrase [Raoultella ornithinolytica]MDI0395870.1 tyrosine-type recombinase/integrase [Raoultella ornithinolytica]
MPLTDLEIRRSKPLDKPYTLNDGNGLSLLIEPNGSKGWRFRYRFDGKPKMLSLGTYPLTSLTEARQKRDEAKKLVASGINPSDVRKRDKQDRQNEISNTFEAIAREWYEKRIERWSAGYAEEMMKTFEADVFPYIGGRPIADIKPMELMGVLSRLDERGATEKLRKVRQRCGEVWRYAIVTGRAEYNPAPDLASAFSPHKKEHYAFLKTEELPEFFRTLNTYSGSIVVKLAMRLQVLTGLRPGELRQGEWSEIDFDKRIWEVPPARMKKRRPHCVPLSDQAIAILEQLKPITGQYIFIFPGRIHHSKPMSEMAMNVLIRRIGYAGRVTGHGFRHTMSTILHEQDYNTAWIETQLAHVDKNSIRGTYNHAQYLDGRREMLQWYADYMEALEGGGSVVHGTFGKRA